MIGAAVEMTITTDNCVDRFLIDSASLHWCSAVGKNDHYIAHIHTTCSVVDKAWLMLKSYLEIHDPSQNYKLQKCVATKLLSLGSHIPQWLIKTYKVFRYISVE